MTEIQTGGPEPEDQAAPIDSQEQGPRPAHLTRHDEVYKRLTTGESSVLPEDPPLVERGYN